MGSIGPEVVSIDWTPYPYSLEFQLDLSILQGNKAVERGAGRTLCKLDELGVNWLSHPAE